MTFPEKVDFVRKLHFLHENAAFFHLVTFLHQKSNTEVMVI